jgi:hypothetical protein
MNALMNLLDKNGSQYKVMSGTTRGMSNGYNFFTGKDEMYSGQPNDLIIHTQQPRGAMVKVLFEPRTKLVDSATYDITAWSLPYVYGLETYASKDKLGFGGDNMTTAINNNVTDAYGYVIRWQGVQSAKALGQFFQKGVKVRFSETPFEINGQQFDRGSLIIIKKGNEKFGNNISSFVNNICNANNIKANTITTGFVDKGFDFGSDKVHPLKASRVALLTGEGVGSNSAGEVWHFFDKTLDYPLTLVNANDFARITLSDFDVIIMPSGNYRFLNEKPATDQLKDWISKGGRLVAIEGGVSQLAKTDWSIKVKKADDSDDKKNTYNAIQIYEDRERDFLSTNTPGSIYKVELDNTHPLAFGYPNFYYTLKQDDAAYEFIKEGGWNVGVIKKENPVAGFVGIKLKDKLKDGLVFGVQDMGQGAIVYFTDNIMFRNFWENGKLMLCNAVFFVGQ